MRQANSSQAQSRVLHNFRFPTLRRLVMIMIIDIIKKRHAITLPITGSQNQPVADHQDPVEQEQCFNFRLLPGGQSSQNQPIKILQINSAYHVRSSRFGQTGVVFELASVARRPIKLESANQDTPNNQRVSSEV